MLKYIFPLSYPKKSIIRALLGYVLVYIVGSLAQGTIIYLTEFDRLGGIVGTLTTVYVFIGLILLAFDHLKLHKK